MAIRLHDSKYQSSHPRPLTFDLRQKRKAAVYWESLAPKTQHTNVERTVDASDTNIYCLAKLIPLNKYIPSGVCILLSMVSSWAIYRYIQTTIRRRFFKLYSPAFYEKIKVVYYTKKHKYVCCFIIVKYIYVINFTKSQIFGWVHIVFITI
jgi:hypothetical protein